MKATFLGSRTVNRSGGSPEKGYTLLLSMIVAILIYSVALVLSHILGAGQLFSPHEQALDSVAATVMVTIWLLLLLLSPAIVLFRYGYLSSLLPLLALGGSLVNCLLFVIAAFPGGLLLPHLFWLLPLGLALGVLGYVYQKHGHVFQKIFDHVTNFYDSVTAADSDKLFNELAYDKDVLAKNLQIITLPICLSLYGVIIISVAVFLIREATGVFTESEYANSGANTFILGFIAAALCVSLIARVVLIFRARIRFVSSVVGVTAPYVLACLATLFISLYGISADSARMQANFGGFGMLLGFAIVPGIGLVLITEHRRCLRAEAAVRHALLYRRFWLHTSWILDQFPQPKEVQGYVFLNTLTCVYTIPSVLLVLCRLRQLGWTTVVVDRWPIKLEMTGQPHADRFFKYDLTDQAQPHFDWTIDWDRQIVETRGLNFYHPIWEGLGRHFGRYFVDISEPGVREIFTALLRMADSTLQLAFRIYRTVAGQGQPVRILGSQGQFVPNAVFSIFCREIGKDRDMHFVWIQQGYQTYYADRAMLSKHISLENMTRAWPYSNPYLARREPFEAWVARGQDVEAIKAEAREWIGTNRTGAQEIKPLARAAFAQIEAHRNRGGKVVCLLGKILFDLSTPWERGPAHSDMKDWLNHSIESVAGADDVLLLIKPHPYEVRRDIAGRVDEYFIDMIDTDVPPNVMILDNDWFNLHALVPVIDLGVLWNGTSGLELGMQGLPIVICSDWGPIDYPVGFTVPKDRDDYTRMLRAPAAVEIADDVPERCVLMLKYTASKEVMIPYDYCARPLTNAPFGPSFWHMDQVKRFIEEGDPNIDYAASKIL